MIIRGHEFDCKNHTYIMGILNVTPDSFHDGGLHNSVEGAVEHALKLIEEGADIIDIGGESTRPGATAVSAEEELGRVIPVIEELRKRSDVPISIDTYKAEVAKCALKSGADIVNDVYSFSDGLMPKVVADSGAHVILMHNRYDIEDGFELKIKLNNIANYAITCGIAKDKIILDPGVGFTVNREIDKEILSHLRAYAKMDYPILLGCSRKRVIESILKDKAGDRLEGTLAVTAMAVMNHISFVRVHDVAENYRIIKTLEALREDKTNCIKEDAD